MTNEYEEHNDEEYDEDYGSSRKLTNSHHNQINVLRSMFRTEETTREPKQFQIEEISALSGLQDEKEVQRYLFILEGQKLVSPYPEGDFTSKTWKITKTGVKALRTIDKSAVNQ